MTARECIRAVVEQWFLVEPLLFAVWTTHTLIINPHIRTIRVGHGRIEYHPQFIEALTRQQLEEVLTCEAMRIVLKHPYIRRREPAILAYAASNLTLQEYLQTSLPLPRARDVFGHSEFDRQYYELYYHQLLALAQPVLMLRLNGDTTSAAAWSGDTLLVVYADADTSGQLNTAEWDVDEFRVDEIDDKIRAAHASNTWGPMAGRCKEQILASLMPRLNYRAVLRQFRTSVRSIRRCLTRMKPNRRYGFVYMGSRYDFTTRLLVAVDVSGSMSQTDIAHGFGVINRFFAYGVPAIDVIQFDTKIQGSPLTLKRAQRQVIVSGRGGTNFTPVIDFLDAHRDYDGAIIFTDGHAPIPRMPQNRRTRVLWLFNTEATYRAMRPALRAIGRAAFLREV